MFIEVGSLRTIQISFKCFLKTKMDDAFVTVGRRSFHQMRPTAAPKVIDQL